MVHIIFIDHEGQRRNAEVREGVSLMEGAIANRIPGIDGDCGGACACATCHVYIDPAWVNRLSPPSELETGMLTMAVETQPTSRLACQIVVKPELEGLTVRTPISQY